MTRQQLIPLIIGALIIAGGAFYGGTIYAKSTARAARGGANGAFAVRAGGNVTFTGGGSGGRGNMAGGFATGKIVSMDDKSITVEMSAMPGASGAAGAGAGSKVIFTSDATKIYKTLEAGMTDLTQNAEVTVIGTANADGSITAQNIQLRPEGMSAPFIGGFTGGRMQGAQPSPAPAQ